MSNYEYGTLLLTTSDDINCDFKLLTFALNQFEWSSSYDLWNVLNVDGADYIVMGKNRFSEVEHPTVSPEVFQNYIFEDEDGNEIQIEEPTEEDFQNGYPVFRETSLEELVNFIYPIIKNGSIEITSVFIDSSNQVEKCTLFINSDGYGKSTFGCIRFLSNPFNSDGQIVYNTEHFDINNPDQYTYSLNG
jgi:hypothetical protein